MASQPSQREQFEIAIICALPLEYDAICLLFDEFWDEDGDPYGRARGDANNYTTGRIGRHNVVLALLCHMGKANAASAAANVRSSYGGIRLALLVGICGGVPQPSDGADEIFLGDVIISNLIIQYDFGRQYPDKFIRKDTVDDNLGKPTKDIRNLLLTFETERGRDRLHAQTAYFLKNIQAKATRPGKYIYPGLEEDRLFLPNYRHKHRITPTCICQNCRTDSDPVCHEALETTCKGLGCEDAYLTPRRRREATHLPEQDGSAMAPRTVIHVGTVASGDIVMKSAADREKIAEKEGVIAFEMEGAGIWEEVPCIIVKGVCDYADCHKNKKWQNFAAATAACASKALLERYTLTDRSSTDENLTTITPYTPQDSQQPQGPNFYAPISGKYVIPGAQASGNSTLNFYF